MNLSDTMSIKTEIKTCFITTITTFFPESAYFYQDYEGEPVGYEQGDRESDVTPHCGRQALSSPNAIYVAGLTVIAADNVKGGEFNLQQYSRVRFSA